MALRVALVRLSIATTVLLLCSLSSGRARACAAAPPEGVQVNIRGEDALIVWDEANQRQHFIRRASFLQRTQQRPQGQDRVERNIGFGFIVPTPSRPELAEAPDAVFERLVARIQPRIEKRTKYTVVWSLCASMLPSSAEDGSGPKTASVQVLDEKRVAGLDAVVLKADDSDALAAWLTAHGYAFRPELRSWLKVYVDNGWIVTAFKMAPNAANGSADLALDSSAVRMSFDTDRPFYPYREPSDQPSTNGRSLRVFFVGSNKVDATVGETDKWPAQLLFADAVTEASALLDGVVPAETLQALNATKPWLSAYLDHARKRSDAGDLWFRASDAEAYLPVKYDDNTVTIPIFVDVLIFFGLFGASFVRWRRRRKQV